MTSEMEDLLIRSVTSNAKLLRVILTRIVETSATPHPQMTQDNIIAALTESVELNDKIADVYTRELQLRETR